MIVLTILLILLLYLPSRHIQKTFSGTTANPIKLKLENCKLFIIEDSGIGTSSVEFDIDLPGSSYSFNAGSTTELSVINKLSIMDTCFVDMKINPQAQFSALEISCSGTCKVVQVGSNPHNLGSGTFTLTEKKVDFMATQMAAGQVSATVG